MPAITAIASGLAAAGGAANTIAGGAKQRRMEDEAAEQRRRAKEAQLAALGQARRPEMSAQASARMKALQQESQKTSLVEDPYFQGQRAQVVQGGQQALSGIQNTQAASGAKGGFANQGSVSDVMDRVGGQLAQIGQQSTQLKEEKANRAAQMEQDQLNAQIEFDNAQARARAAIEAGDAQAAQDAINAAMSARERQTASENALLGGVAGGLADVFGKDWGGRAATPGTTTASARSPEGDEAAQALRSLTGAANPFQTGRKTWASMRAMRG